MMSAQNRLAFFVLLTIVGGCAGTPYRNTVKNETVWSKYVSFTSPGEEWMIARDYKTAIYKASGIEPVPRSNVSLDIHSHIPGSSLNISLVFFRYRGEPFFDKDAQFQEILDDVDMSFSNIDKEQGINYERAWITYVKGMKCSAGVFSRGYGGMMASVANKNYGVTCGYYDRQEGRRIISIQYRYSYAAGITRHQKGQGTKNSEFLTQTQAEMVLKRAVKRVVESLEIKRLDRERMEREGLMHYGKKFEISPF